MMRANAPAPNIHGADRRIHRMSSSHVAILANPAGEVKRFLMGSETIPNGMPRAKGERIKLGAVLCQYRR
jgi:hypothetical protein